jgi:hypothetical protein
MLVMRPLTPHEERRIAVIALVDPRTVRAYLSGRRVRPTCASRIDGALKRLRLGTVAEEHVDDGA